MGKEYEGRWFDDYLAKEGIKHETTSSYTPQQNGVAERANRILMEAERSIMFSNPKSSVNKQKKSLIELWGAFPTCLNLRSQQVYGQL
jgi:transposase InsO family protein